MASVDELDAALKRELEVKKELTRVASDSLRLKAKFADDGPKTGLARLVYFEIFEHYSVAGTSGIVFRDDGSKYLRFDLTLHRDKVPQGTDFDDITQQVSKTELVRGAKVVVWDSTDDPARPLESRYFSRVSCSLDWPSPPPRTKSAAKR